MSAKKKKKLTPSEKTIKRISDLTKKFKKDSAAAIKIMSKMDEKEKKYIEDLKKLDEIVTEKINQIKNI